MRVQQRSVASSAPGQAGAQPFEPALPVLRMNRAVARFTSSAPTLRLACAEIAENGGADFILRLLGRLRQHACWPGTLFFLRVRAAAGIGSDGCQGLAVIGDFDDLRIAAGRDDFGAPGVSVRVNPAEDDTLGLAAGGIFEIKFAGFDG